MIGVIERLWVYRHFVYGSVAREFRGKYNHSILGIAWTVIQPLSMILVYTVIFSQIMQAKLPGIDGSFAYSIYLCSGILTWGLFQEITSRCQNMFLDNSNLIKKVRLPWFCLPMIIVGTALLNFSIIFGIFIIFLVFSGSFPGLIFLAVIPVLFLQIIFSVGLGMVIGILNVFFRDIGQAFSVILQFWFWFTPIVYPITILPESLQTFVDFNPMLGIIDSYQAIIVYGSWPDWPRLFLPILSALFFSASGFWLFERKATELVDEL